MTASVADASTNAHLLRHAKAASQQYGVPTMPTEFAGRFRKMLDRDRPDLG